VLAALIVIVAVAVAYVQALGGPFLWDDRLLILGVPLVERTAPLGEYLRHPFWTDLSGPEALSYYRPLVTLSFALDHRIHGDNPGGYHLTNFLLHEANALLLLALLRRFGVRPLVAALVASAWALLPRLAEAAAWISGRTDLIAATCVLGALVCWDNSLARRLMASVLVFAGLLAKESALAAVPAIAVLDWVRLAPEPARGHLRRFGWRLLPVALAVFGALGLRFFAIGLQTTGESLGFIRRAGTVLDAITTYTLMLLDALRPRAVIGRVGIVRPWGVAVGAAIVLGCVVLLLRFRRRRLPVTSVGLTLAFAAVLPVLHIVPIPVRMMAADRFIYLPTAGLALALGPRLDAWLAERRAAWLIGVAGVVVLGVATSMRVGVWSDEEEFWLQTYLETPPTNCAAATNLVGVFYRAGQYQDALTLSERELSYDDPDKSEARFNATLCLARLGRKEEALARWLAMASKSHKPDVDLQIAIVELGLGHFDAVRARLEPLARANNDPARMILARLPDFARAKEELETAPASDVQTRARLATFLGEETIAVPAWVRVASDLNVSKAALREGLSYLVQTGDRDAIAFVARRYLGLFGALDRRLAGVVSERLDEIDRLRGERSRVGL
jgi:protein O-mannosyl-transferase